VPTFYSILSKALALLSSDVHIYRDIPVATYFPPPFCFEIICNAAFPTWHSHITPSPFMLSSHHLVHAPSYPCILTPPNCSSCSALTPSIYSYITQCPLVLGSHPLHLFLHHPLLFSARLSPSCSRSHLPSILTSPTALRCSALGLSFTHPVAHLFLHHPIALHVRLPPSCSRSHLPSILTSPIALWCSALGLLFTHLVIPSLGSHPPICCHTCLVLHEPFPM
jgi:hypothetical protein